MASLLVVFSNSSLTQKKEKRWSELMSPLGLNFLKLGYSFFLQNSL
jgi:hypothetical protein